MTKKKKVLVGWVSIRNGTWDWREDFYYYLRYGEAEDIVIPVIFKKKKIWTKAVDKSVKVRITIEEIK